MSRSILRLPAAFYGIVSLAAFAPCWLTGRAYFDNDLLAQFGPWRQFLKDSLAKGDLPLWNPYLMGGTPFFADPQNMLLYPFNWPTLLLPVAGGLTLFFMVHMAWAGWGMHLWLGTFRLSEASCRVGGLLFCLSGFFWMEIIHPPVLAAFAWLPWLFLSLERLATTPTPRRGFLAGLSLAMLFLCGSFQVFLGGLYGGSAYFLFRTWGHVGANLAFAQKKGSGKRAMASIAPTVFLAVVGGAFWGALPLLGQLIPTAEFSALTHRRVEGLDYAMTHAKLSLAPSSLHQLVLPRFDMKKDTSLQEALQSLDEKRNLWPMLGYLGVWVPFLAFWAFRGRDKKLPALLLGLTLLGLALSLGRHFPVHRLFHEVLPGFDLIRVPFRYLYLFALGLSALAALGHEAWSSQMNGKPQRGPLMGAVGYGALLYLVALWRPLQDWREMAALGLGLAGLLLGGLSQKRPTAGKVLFQAALTLPLLLSGWACFRPAPSVNFDFKKNSSMLQGLGPSPHRVLFLGKNYYPIEFGGRTYALPYPSNAACALGLKNFGGYNPLALNSKSDLASLPLGTLVKLGAIRAVVSQQEDLVLPGFKARSIALYTVHEWQGDLPYVFAPERVEVVQDKEERLGRLAEASFDPLLTGILSDLWVHRDPDRDEAWEKGPVRLGYRLEEDACDRQVFSVGLDKDKLVVFCETAYPGWRAVVDGYPAKIHTTDHFLRGVFLKKGDHHVEFRFEPWWWPGIPIGLTLWLALTVAGFFMTGDPTITPGRGEPRGRPRLPSRRKGDGKHRPYKHHPGKTHA